MVLGKLSRVLLTHLTKRTSATWDDDLVFRLAGPLTLLWTLALVYVAAPWMHWSPMLLSRTQRIFHAGIILVVFWGIWRVIEVIHRLITGSRVVTENPAVSSLVPLLARVSKVIVLALALVVLLSDLGYPVASIVAGLGIGGLAVALAARSTLENLFGAFSIAADRPFREGDFVKVEDFVGNVENIGLRSTRFRTLDRTLVSMPNGKLADMRLESYTARDRIRLSCIIGLTYATTAQAMRNVLAGFERVLRAHPKIWPDAVVVRFREFAQSSLDIEIMAWFQTQDFGEFQLIRQEVLLSFMEVVENAGASFAFPTRTIHWIPEQDNTKRANEPTMTTNSKG
jgi:MscS family membrane protein